MIGLTMCLFGGIWTKTAVVCNILYTYVYTHIIFVKSDLVIKVFNIAFKPYLYLMKSFHSTFLFCPDRIIPYFGSLRHNMCLLRVIPYSHWIWWYTPVVSDMEEIV